MKAGNEGGASASASAPGAAYEPLPQPPPPTRALLQEDEDEDEDVDVEANSTDLNDLGLQNRHQRQSLAYRSHSPSSSPSSRYVDDPKTGDRGSIEMSAYAPGLNHPSTYSGGSSEADLVGPPPAAAKEGRKGDKIALYVALLSLGTMMIGTWLLVLLNHPSRLGLFAAHPTLQTLAIFCFGLGILLLQPTSQPKTKVQGLTRHQLVILGLGLPSIIVGTSVIFANKTIYESPHFTTWHATFGLIAVVWMVIQMLLGGLSVWFGGRAFGGGMKAKKVWRYHRASGYSLFPLFLMTAAVGGNYSDWTASVANVGVRVLLYTLAPIFALVALWSRVRLSKMNFLQ